MEPIDGVTIECQNEDNTIWHVTLEGPSGTPYEGGKFVISADFTDNYPFKPPVCKFITRIYHPNVKKDTGDICKDIYEAEWVPTKTIKGVIDVFKTLLLAPQLDVPLEAEIAK